MVEESLTKEWNVRSKPRQTIGDTLCKNWDRVNRERCEGRTVENHHKSICDLLTEEEDLTVLKNSFKFSLDLSSCFNIYEQTSMFK